MRKLLLSICLISIFMGGSSAHAVGVDFNPFNIRNNGGTVAPPWDVGLSIVENAAGDGFSAATPLSGQKVGYGTNAFNGRSLNTLSTVDWDKVSGKIGVVSYLNFWVQRGLNYAIIASENDYRGTDFSTRQEWKVFEYDTTVSLDWLLGSGTGGRTSQYLTKDGVNVNLSDLHDDVVLYTGAPPGSNGVGTGAPQGGYGFNLIFGDTQSNFVGSYALENLTMAFGDEQFEAANLAPVPIPAAVWMFGSAIMGFVGFRRRKRLLSAGS